MSDSVRPCRQQPTRFLRPWDSPGKNAGVGCHFLVQCMKVKSESEVAQSCLTLRNSMDCSLTGSSVHGSFQARVLEWGAIAFSVISLLVSKTNSTWQRHHFKDCTSPSSAQQMCMEDSLMGSDLNPRQVLTQRSLWPTLRSCHSLHETNTLSKFTQWRKKLTLETGLMGLSEWPMKTSIHICWYNKSHK